MALSESMVRRFKPGARAYYRTLPVAAGQEIFQGSACMVDNAYLKVGSQAPTSMNPIGGYHAMEEVDNSGGVNGAKSCQVSTGERRLYKNSATAPVTAAYLQKRIRLEDDDTVCIGSSGPEHGIFEGFLDDTNTDYCWVTLDAEGAMPSTASAAPKIAATQTLAADGELDLSGDYDIYPVAGDGGDITTTEDLPDATDGRLVIIRGTDDAAKYTIPDDVNTELIADQSAPLGDGDELWLRGHATVWREVHRSIKVG